MTAAAPLVSLADAVRGWFVGPFAPAALATDACEVAVKRYRAGDLEAAHVHRLATELTVVVSGRIRMAGREHGPDAIVAVAPGDATDFACLEDAVTVVVKVPGIPGDKHPVPEPAP